MRKDKREILARGDFRSDLAFDEGLSIVSDPTPHPRHAIVTQWPEDKALMRMKAMTLAQGSTLFLHPRHAILELQRKQIAK